MPKEPKGRKTPRRRDPQRRHRPRRPASARVRGVTGGAQKRPPRRAACHLLLCCQLVCKSAAVELRRRSAGVGGAPLVFKLVKCRGSGRKLQHCGLLALAQPGQERDLPVRKFQRVVMHMQHFLVDLAKDRGVVL